MKRSPGIRHRLAVLILASAVPAVLVAAALLVEEHQRNRERIERDTIATARAMVNAVDRELIGMQVAAQVLSTSQRVRAGDLAGFYAQAQEVAAKGLGANVVLSDASGRQIMNTLRPLGEALPMHGNLQQHRAVLASGAPAVSDLYLGGVLRRPVMSVDVPVSRDGRVVYVLSVGEVPDRFRAILSEQKLPAGWIGAVFDRTGTVVARTHEHERFVGERGAPELVARMLEAHEGALDAVTLEGIAVVSLFSRSSVSGWSVALGIPRGDFTAGLWRRSLLAALAAGAVLALGLALAWSIGGRTARSIRALVEPASRIGRREPIELSPLGLKEADEVGEALARAARLISSAEHRAQHDPLTGLANAALFREVAAHRAELCKRTGAAVAVLFIDLDGFKAVNDAHGHEVGDALLCAVAGRVKSALRASDLAARMGGDEFAVLLEGTGGEAAQATAAKLSELLAQPYQVSGQELKLSASIGVASCPHSGSTAEELIGRADEAMYRVKSSQARAIAGQAQGVTKRNTGLTPVKTSAHGGSMVREMGQQAYRYIRFFEELSLADVPLVGGKNASLGELYRRLTPRGVRVPNGFATTAEAYWLLLERAGARDALRAALAAAAQGVEALAAAAAKAREIVRAAPFPPALAAEILDAHRRLAAQYGAGLSVAVRSSATAEDLPTASFAGQHESYLNVAGGDALIEACRNCFVSLFTDRAVRYRIDQGFDHFKVALSVGVMKMVRADLGASGVVFTLDTESGFRDVVFLTGAWGLGENVVQGAVDPDEFYVFKPAYRAGKRAVLKRSLGGKAIRMVYGEGGRAVKNVDTTPQERSRYCLADAEVLELAGSALAIEEHYRLPMDIEWAKDGVDGKLYVIQARPETVVSQRAAGVMERYALKTKAKPLLGGHAVGERIACGRVRVVRAHAELAAFRPGEVLVAAATEPDWGTVMKSAAAIVTDRGGRTCHAAIVARELGIPAVVGAGDATSRLKSGDEVTVSCAEGEIGHVYAGALPFERLRLDLAAAPKTRTEVMVNLGNPDGAFRASFLPADGVGLARMEFIIAESIRAHPMALAHPERVADAAERKAIEELARGYPSPADFFVERLSEGVATIAAAFWPKPVIVRLSDFKSNEYASLLGGRGFEPAEENPMLGFRGASRYAHPAYADGFALECRAMKRVRGEMGLPNVKLMIPFCRRIDEAERVLAEMARHGLARGADGLEVYVMCEIPNNVIQADAFARLFDGFSIGSNDLTQLALGVDRDSDLVAFDFDERDAGVKTLIRMAIDGARRNRRHVGICGQAPADYPELIAFLVEAGITSISVNPDSVLRTRQLVAQAESASRTPALERSC